MDLATPLVSIPFGVKRLSWLALRLGWLGRGGSIELLFGSRGTRGGGGLYAGYLEVIS